ncbi:MAG: transposase family protein, partial [Bacteroidales bacterium]
MKNKGPEKERERLFTNSFSTLEDPRRTNKGYYSYPLIEILFLCISASLSGFSTWTDIALFGKEKLEWLRKFYPYTNGTPSHDVLG